MEPTEHDIASLFDRISGRYDFLNHVLSGFTDARWRKRTVKISLSHDTKMVLDVSTGTGDMAIEYAGQRSNINVYGVDISMEMLKRAKIKSSNINFVKGSGLCLPFKDNTFNLVSCAFGIRNIHPREQGVKEFYRVLKHGGIAAILEFSMPDGLFGKIYKVYFEKVLPRIGNMISKTGAYSYLRNSVETFPQPHIFTGILASAGFRDITITSLTHGIATIYLCKRR